MVDVSLLDGILNRTDIKGWFNMVSNYISIIALCVSLAALLVTIYFVNRQIKLSDMNIYFNLTKELADAGQRIRLVNNNIEERDNRCLDLLYLINSMCHLYNRNYFYSVTKDMVKIFLLDYLPIFAKDKFMSQFLNSRNNKRAFYEIKRFACKHSIHISP